MRKLLYAGTDHALYTDMRAGLDGRFGLHMCLSGPEALEDFLVFLPDILIVEMNFPGCNTVDLLHAARSRARQTKTIVLATAHIGKLLLEFGPDILVTYPASLEKIIAAIDQLEAADKATLEDQIDGLLQHLGLDCGNEGFGFLRSAIIYKYNNPQCLFTSDLCVHVAKLHNTTAQAVDKTMSRCIHRAWKYRNPVLWDSYLVSSTKTASCNAFITAVVTYLK